jgi:hypothetical protein
MRVKESGDTTAASTAVREQASRVSQLPARHRI